MARIKVKLLGQHFQTFYHMFVRILCLIMIVTQSAILDYYLIYHSSSLLSILWIIPDVIVFAVFLAAFIISYRFLKKRLKIQEGVSRICGDLPLSFVSWFLLSTVLSAKVCILFVLPDSIAMSLDERNFFGPNTLKTGIALSSIIIYLLVLCHNDFKTHSKQNEFVQGIVGSIYLDVLDTTQFIGALTESTDMDIIRTNNIDKVILGIICFNFILPTEALIIISKSKFGVNPLSPKFQLLHKVCYFLVVNLPMFIVRMIIWHAHMQNISVFVVKNILAIGMSIRDIHEFFMDVSEVIVPSIKNKLESEEELELEEMEKKRIGPFIPGRLLGEDKSTPEVSPSFVSVEENDRTPRT